MNSEHPVKNYVLKLQPTVLVCVELTLKNTDATKEGLFQENKDEGGREREKDERDRVDLVEKTAEGGLCLHELITSVQIRWHPAF